MAYKFQKGHADMSGSLTQLGAVIVSGTLSASSAIDGLSLKIGTTEVLSSARELKNIASADAGTQQVIEDYMIQLDNLASIGSAGSELEAVGSLDVAQGLKVANSAVVTDALELSNIASLDATTEATVEAAIDTLANLVSAGTAGTDLVVAGPLDLEEGLKQNGTEILSDAGALKAITSVSASSAIEGGSLAVRSSISGAVVTATYMTASGHVSASQFFGNGAGLKGISSDTVDTTTSTTDAVYYVPFVDQATGQDGETLYIQDSMQLNPSDDSVVVVGAFQGGSLKAANLNDGHLTLVGASGVLAEDALFQYSTDRTEDEPYATLFVSSSASGSAYLGDGVVMVADEANEDVFLVMSGAMEFYPAPSNADLKLEATADGFFYGDQPNTQGFFIDMSTDIGGFLASTTFQANGASEFAGQADFNGLLKSNNKLQASGMISGSAGLALSGAVNFDGALDVAGDTKLAASGVGTQVRGDLTVDEAATFQDSVKIQNSKKLTLNGGSSHIVLNGVNCLISGSGAIKLSGSATFGGNVVSDGFGQFAGKITANSVDSSIAATATTLASADAMYFTDFSDSGFVKKVTMPNLGDYLAGDGLTYDPATGVLSTTAYAAPNAIGDASETMTAGVNWGSSSLGANRTWTLPASANVDVGDRVVVKAPDVGAFHIKIAANTAQQIDGSTDDLLLEADFAAVELLYVAANNWRVV